MHLARPVWIERACLRLLVLALVSLLGTGHATGQGFETELEHVILYDVETRSVLYQRDADAPMPPASMAKLMTMALLFEALRDGTLSMDDTFVVSEHAWRTGGAPSGTSTMFAELGSEIAIRDLMRGVIVQSGNDAAITIAEGMAGSESAFAEAMNEAAVRIGLTGSVFTNPTGLPDPDQFVTARDLAKLATYIITEFPEYYAIYGERSFTWNGITQSNRNPLLGLDIGADGVKTGFTDASGYGLVGSAMRGDRRLVAVINGAETAEQRQREMVALLDWGFTGFTRLTLFDEGEIVAEADVFGGNGTTVPLAVANTVAILIPDDATGDVEARAVYRGPIPAPIEVGTPLAELSILLGDETLATAPLVAADSVGRGTLPERARDALNDLLFGWR